MELVFNIQGEFITQTARDWFYLERKPFEKVKELLLSCMCGTDISKETLNQYVEDILKFKRKFVGETQNDTFCLVEDDEENEKGSLSQDDHALLICGYAPYQHFFLELFDDQPDAHRGGGQPCGFFRKRREAKGG